jgi:hypothetical protein
MAKTKLEIIITAKDKASGVLGKVGGALGGIARFGAGAGVVALGGIGAGLGFAAKAGLDFNNSMELTRARLDAFTKDGAKTAELLEMIRTRAAATPFAFGEMSNAAAGLLPAAKQANIGLETLIEKAEILAASNPEQGLEGAAFALREALSGDFTSIIERFNLPRKYINDLRKQGVPDLEIVSQAMQQMGLDTDLVTGLAETATGRWSTFTDTLTGFAGQMTQPIFDTFSAGLGDVNEKLTLIAPSLQDGLAALMSGETELALQNFQHAMLLLGFPPEQIQSITESARSIIDSISNIGVAISEINMEDIAQMVNFVVNLVEGIVWTIEKTQEAISIAAGLADQINKISEAYNKSGALESAAAIGTMGLSRTLPQAVQAAQGGGGGGSAPPITVNVPLYLDGEKIAENTSGRQSEHMKGLIAQGGMVMM